MSDRCGWRLRVIRWSVTTIAAASVWCGTPGLAPAQDTSAEPSDPTLERPQSETAEPGAGIEALSPPSPSGEETPVSPQAPTEEPTPVELPQTTEPEASGPLPPTPGDQPVQAPLQRPPEPAPVQTQLGTAPAAAPPSAPPPVEPVSTPWSFGLTMGYYRPRLNTLNRILRDTSVTILQDPNFLLPRNIEFPFEERNLAVAGIEGGPTYGVDAVYNTGGAHSFGLSFSGWHGEKFGYDLIPFFLRSNTAAIDVPRSARYNLILDQIFWEWRYHLFRNAQGKGVYVNVGLVGVTFAFLTMDSLVNVIVGPPDNLSFASTSSDESFGWGYTTRFGMGGDYPLTSWLSIGGRANYVLGTIRRMEVTRHFLAGFPAFPPDNPLTRRPGLALPTLFFAPRDGVPVTYAPVTTDQGLQETAAPGRLLTLELSGWEGLIALSVRF